MFLQPLPIRAAYAKIKKNPALQDSPPAADRFSDRFNSAAVRSCGDAVSYEIKKNPTGPHCA